MANSDKPLQQRRPNDTAAYAPPWMRIDTRAAVSLNVSTPRVPLALPADGDGGMAIHNLGPLIHRCHRNP